jgi:putative YhbY family RNA-binding protein
MPSSVPATPPLSAAQRAALRAAAHHLDPVVMIGDAGLSAGVLAEADRALTAHELIKLRVFGDDRQLRRDILAALCAELGCQPVQEIGKLLVVYRQRPPEAPREHVPKKLAAAGGKPARKAKPAPVQRRAGSGPVATASRRASAPRRSARS